jgi:hypothetical protein
MIRTSDQINEISEAMAKAQGKFGAAIKNSQNPAFHSKYADLSAVIDATLEHLNAEGVTCMQHPALTYSGEGESREALITVTTRLLHKSGQWIESDLSIPAVQRDRFDAQSCGSALTYACRYALQSICVVPREDDDGNTAAGIGSKQAAKEVGKAKAKEMATEDVRTLFFVYPEQHNGNYAEFLNLKQFGSALNEIAQEGLRLTFKKYMSKNLSSKESVLIPLQNMEPLLNELKDCGVPVHQLEAK